MSTFREQVRALVCKKLGHKFVKRTYEDGKAVDSQRIDDLGTGRDHQLCYRCGRWIP